MSDKENVSLLIPVTKISGLSAGNGRFLKIIENLMDVELEAADGGFLYSGTAASSGTVRKILNGIDYFLKRGDEIDEQTVRYICTLARENRLDSFLENSDEVILVTPKGKSIRPKTLGQRVYIDAQKHNELVLCVGPAGTGKTSARIKRPPAPARIRGRYRIRQ